MSTDLSSSARAHKESWLPILDLAVEEVFEIMLGCRVKAVTPSEYAVPGNSPPWSVWPGRCAEF